MSHQQKNQHSGNRWVLNLNSFLYPQLQGKDLKYLGILKPIFYSHTYHDFSSSGFIFENFFVQNL